MKTTLYNSLIYFLLIVLIVGAGSHAQAQEEGQEKTPKQNHYYGRVQLGLTNTNLGIHFIHEHHIIPKLSARGSIGLLPAYQKDLKRFTISPTFGIEPRWNFRVQHNKQKGNSSNFVGLPLLYAPNKIGTINTTTNKFSVQEVSPYTKVGVHLGIRRNLNRHFFYELALGVGYTHYFGNSTQDKNSFFPLIGINIGLNCY